MIFAGADNTMRQRVEMEVGKRDSFSLGEAAGATAIGAVGGAAVGTIFDLAAGKIARTFRARRGADPAPEVTPEAAPQPGTEVSTINWGAKKSEGESLIPQKLKGRRPEDDWMTGPVGLDKTDLKAAGFKLDDIKTGLRTTPRNLKEAKEMAAGLARQIRNMEATEVEAVTEALRRTEMTMEEHSQLALSVQMATDQLKVERAYLITRLMDPKVGKIEAVKLQKQLREVEDIIVPVELMDEAMSSMYGSGLAQRRQGLTDLRGISVETIKQQFPKLSDEQARKLYADTVLRARAEKQARAVRREFDPQIERLAKTRRTSVWRSLETGKVLSA